MDQVKLTRASLLANFADFFAGIGAPVDRELGRHSLPTALDLPYEAFVPVIAAARFVRSMAHKEQIDDPVFWTLKGRKVSTLKSSPLSAALYEPTLFARLRRFFHFVHCENPGFQFRIERNGEVAKIGVSMAESFRVEGLHLFEWTIILQIVTIMRQSLPTSWQPEEIRFRSQFTLCDDALACFHRTRFLFGQKESSIMVPAACLSRSLVENDLTQNCTKDGHLAGQSFLREPLDFPTSLKLALYAYLGDGYPSINLAAGIVGISVRSLQRRLAEYGLTYPDLIGQARFEIASQLLGNSDMKVIDVSFALGYEDPSHFARAFRRISGTSPREYRRDLAAH